MSDQFFTNAEFQISGDTLRKYTGQSRHLVISEDIKGIASAAFLDVNTLESVTIPDGVEFLDRRCFENCLHLKTVSIPDSVTRIGEYAFSGCRDLDYVRLPAGLSRIESYTFKDCASLTAVIIPPGVTEIAVDAFIGCSSLESVHIHEGVTSFPSIFNHHPFTGCDNLKIYTPSGSAAEKFAKENGIPYIIKVIDSPNQATDIVKPDAPKPKVTRQTIASTKGIFSFSDIEEYLPEDLTDKLLRQAEEEEAAKKARIAAALAPSYSEEPADAGASYEPEEVYPHEKVIYESEHYQSVSAAAVEAAPVEKTVAEDPVVRVEAPKPAATVATVPEPVAPIAEAPRPAAPIAEAPRPVAPIAETPRPAAPVVEAPKPAAPATAAANSIAAAPTATEPLTPVPAVQAPEPITSMPAAPIPVAPIQAAPEPVWEAEPVKASTDKIAEEPVKVEEVVKTEKPVKAAGSLWKKKAPKEKPAKEKKPPKEKPVKEKKPPKEKPVKEKKEKKKKEPRPKSSKGRTVRIAALLVIAAVAVAVIVIAAMNMNIIKPQTSDEPTSKTEEIQKDDYVLTLEDFVNSSDTARSQIDQSIDGTDVKVTVSGNKLIYTYDLSNTEGLSEEDADSDEIRKALEGTLDASNDRFVDLCRSLEKDTGVSGISVEVIYSYGDKILLTREYTANGQKN